MNPTIEFFMGIFFIGLGGTFLMVGACMVLRAIKAI